MNTSDLVSPPTELRKRVYTASLLAIVVIGLCLLADRVPAARWLVGAVSFLAVGMAAGEYSLIVSDKKLYSITFWFLLSLTILPAMVQFLCGLQFDSAVLTPALLMATGATFVLAFLFISVHQRVSPAASLLIWAELCVGIVLLSFGGGALVTLAFLPRGVSLLFWLLVVVCFNDIGAYFTGRFLGGPRFAPTISPKKTFSGSIGGVVWGVLGGAILGALLQRPVDLVWTSIIALAIILAGQSGDLMKSLIKRQHNVKDSGNILPGHGGILDRIDGILMGAPVLLAARQLLLLSV